MFINKQKIKSVIRQTLAGYSIVALVATSFVFQTPSTQAGDYALVVKEFTLDVAARVLAQKVMRMVEERLMKQLTSEGVAGNEPAWVRSWLGTVNKARKQGLSKWQATVDIAAYGSEDGEYNGRAFKNDPAWCNYFRDGLAPLFGAKRATAFEAIDGAPRSRNPTGEFDLLATTKCTLPEKIIVNGVEQEFEIKDYINDFEAGGGWDTFLSLAEPNNNIWDVIVKTSNKKEDFMRTTEQYKVNEAMSGDGFLCTTLDGGHEDCSTPGKVLAETAQSIITKNFDWITSTDELSELVASVIGIMVDRLGDFCGNGGVAEAKCQEKSYDQMEEAPEDVDINQSISESSDRGSPQDCRDFCESEASAICEIGDKSISEELQCKIRHLRRCSAQFCGGQAIGPSTSPEPAEPEAPPETP